MEMDYRVTDLIDNAEALAGKLGTGIIDDCDLCGGGALVVHLKLNYFSERGGNGEKVGVDVCLDCYKDVVDLYKKHSDEWHSRERELADKLKGFC